MLNSEMRLLATLVARISTSSGLSSQGDASMLRISVDTRAFDCEYPIRLTFKPDQLVKQMHRLCAIRLQGLDHLLAGEQRGNLVPQLLDLVDLLVELGDLALEERIAIGLVFDALVGHVPHRTDNRDADRGGNPRQHGEMLPRPLAPLLAVRQ